MALAKKVLKGIGKALTTENTIANDGGWSSLLIPRQVNAAGAGLIVAGTMGASLASEGMKSRNKNLMGRISYDSGLARMTNSFSSGAPEAMRRASGGNYEVFSDLAEEVVTSSSLSGKLETYGATPELISALYNMGGR